MKNLPLTNILSLLCSIVCLSLSRTGPSASTSEGHTSAMDIDDSKLCARDGPSSSHDFTKHSKSQIIPQRAALLKSILNFLKKAILDPSVSDSVRTGK